MKHTGHLYFFSTFLHTPHNVEIVILLSPLIFLDRKSIDIHFLKHLFFKIKSFLSHVDVCLGFGWNLETNVGR